MSAAGLGEILAVWRARREAGEGVEPEEVIRAHPEHAEALRRAFAALELLDRAALEALPAAAADLGGGGKAPPFPARLGDFRLIEPLGLGSTGNVYEAEQVSMGRRVALKILHPSMTLSPRAVARFRREARLAGRLHHTNIVPVHAMGAERGLSWFAMELVRGQDLGRVIEDLRLLAGPAQGACVAQGGAAGATSSGFGTTSGGRDFHRRVARAFAGAADALHAAHAAGVVHRDVKPSNLLLDVQGRLRLLDFGLARASEDGVPVLTATGDVVGTPSYMSPEQVRGVPADGRTDVYGLGASLYELLTLEPPFRGTDVPDCLRRILSRDPVAPRSRDPRIPRDLETVVLRALEKEPSRRYATAEAMARDLRAFADGGSIMARRVGPVGRAWRAVRRHRLHAALLGTVLLLAVAAALLLGSRASERGERLLVESARRDAHYERLVADAAREYIRDHGRGEDETQPSRDLHARAIALAPQRPEAYYQRALCGDRELGQRTSDLAAAEARGFSPRAVRLSRALLLRQAGAVTEADAEERAALSLPWDDPACHLAAGRLALLRGDLRQAENLLARALAEAGLVSMVGYEARRTRARVRSDLGDSEGALRDLDAVWEMGDHGVDVTVERARLWRRIGDVERAERLVSQALAPYLLGATLYQWEELSAVCRAAGEHAAAAKAAAAGLREYPGAWTLEVARARVLVEAHEPAAAVEAAQRAVRLAEGEHDPWCALAAARAARDDVAGGLAAARRAVEVDASCPGAQAALGTLLLRSGEPAQAADVLRRLVRDGTTRAGALAPYLQALLHAGRHEEIVAETETDLSTSPDDAYAHFARGTALIALGRVAESLEPLRRSIAARIGRGAPARANLAHAYELLGRREEALVEAREAVLEDDGNAASHLSLARLLLAAERFGEAVPSAARTAELEPSLTTLEVLLMAQAGAGHPPQELVEVCERALALDARDVTWRLNRVVAWNMAERHVEAERECDALLAERPDDVGAHLERAKALAAQGRAAEAQAAVDRATALAPGDASVMAVRDELGRALAGQEGQQGPAAVRTDAAAEGDARMLARLAAIQDARDDLGDPQAAARAYREAFLAHGIDVARAAPQALAAAIRSSAIAEDLGVGLDAWRLATGTSGELRPELESAVRALDADPWRARLRDAGDLAALRRVAAESDLGTARLASLFELAERLAGLGAGAEARDLLARVAGARRGEFRAQLAAGLAHAHESPPLAEEAERYLAAAHEIRPRSAMPSQLLGELRRRRGDLRGAAAAFREAIAAQPGFPRARTALVSTLEALGDDDGAERALREAILQEPHDARHRGQLADLLERRRRPAEAIEALRVAVKLEPREARWRVRLGRRLGAAHFGEEAVRQLSEAVALAPQDVEARLELGRSQQRRGDLDAAIGSFRTAVQRDEGSWEAHRLLGRAHALRGDVDDAVLSLRRVTELRRDDEEAWSELASALHAGGDPAAARAILEAAHARFPDSIVVLGSLGRQRQSEGRIEQSLAMRRRAHDLAMAQGEGRYPTAAWLAEAEEARRLEQRLAEMLRGEGPEPTPVEAEDLANVAQTKGLLLTAARLYAAAFDGDPRVAARDLNRWAAAGAALAIGLGEGDEAATIPASERVQWLERARGWVEADLDLLARRAVFEPQAVRALVPRLQRDRALARVRGDALGALPEGPRAAWERVWQALEALRTRGSSLPADR